MTQSKKYPGWGLFKKGNHITEAGNPYPVDDAKLDQIVTATKNFPYQNNEIPIVIGHPKSDSPKWGSVLKDNIAKIGNEIFGTPNYLVPEFEEWIGKKLYDTVSIALRGDGSIRHIALLGGMPPAVTGLSPVHFGEADTALQFAEFNELELSKWWFQGLAGLLRGIKNYLIDKEGQEKADLILPEYPMTDLMNPPVIFNSGPNMNSNFSENNNEDIMTPEQKLEYDRLIAENQTLKANELKLANEKRESGYVAFCESDDMKTRITPKIKPIVIAMMAKVEESGEICFAEEGVEKKVSALDEFKNLLMMLPKSVEFGEHATHGVHGENESGVTKEVETGNKIADIVNNRK